MINIAGQAGLIATNTLAQGDTREVGLDQLIAHGITIRKAIKSAPWPSRSAVLEYCAVWTTQVSLPDAVERVADGVKGQGITSSLDSTARVVGKAERLAANSGISHFGILVNGMGFTIEYDRVRELVARDSRYGEVLFPYLNGQDLNSRPDCSASRWIIDFRDWSQERAKSYTACYEQILTLVKPERDKVRRKIYRERWWQYAENQMSMRLAIVGLDRVIVITLVSKAVMPVMVPNGQVFSHALGVFASDDTAMFALLSSVFHYWWTIGQASTLETRIRYTISDVFETFAQSALTQEMRDIGGRLDMFRRELMLARKAGLTKTYNLVHDPKCADSDIAELREIHRKIDHAVAHAYGWDDLELDHGFHETRQGVRYTVGPVVRQEILDRLLELNHERYAAEVAAGLHDEKRRKGGSGEQGELFGS